MKGLETITRLLSTNQTLSGIGGLIGTILGVITAVRSDDLWQQIPGIFFALIFGLTFLHSIRQPLRDISQYLTQLLRDISQYLTWKFFLGVVVGIMLTVVFHPFIELPSIGRTVTPLSLNVIRSEPANGGTIDSPDHIIKVFFSEDIEESRRDLIEVSVDPRHRLKLSWIVDDLMSRSPNPTNELHIRSIEYQEDGKKRFKYDTDYQLTIAGAALDEPVVIEFHTPPRPD